MRYYKLFTFLFFIGFTMIAFSFLRVDKALGISVLLWFFYVIVVYVAFIITFFIKIAFNIRIKFLNNVFAKINEKMGAYSFFGELVYYLLILTFTGILVGTIAFGTIKYLARETEDFADIIGDFFTMDEPIETRLDDLQEENENISKEMSNIQKKLHGDSEKLFFENNEKFYGYVEGEYATSLSFYEASPKQNSTDNSYIYKIRICEETFCKYVDEHTISFDQNDIITSYVHSTIYAGPFKNIPIILVKIRTNSYKTVQILYPNIVQETVDRYTRSYLHTEYRDIRVTPTSVAIDSYDDQSVTLRIKGTQIDTANDYDGYLRLFVDMYGNVNTKRSPQ